MNVFSNLYLNVYRFIAFSELFDSGWTVGDMQANDLTGFVWRIGSAIAVTVISVVGFLIVVSSILKNSCAGLYCANQKFWDKVAVAKTRKIEQSFKDGIGKDGKGNQITAVLGSAETVLLALLPNIKSYTEFDGQNLDPKGYFMKAIPAMVVVVFVGVMIFFGYPTKIAAKFAEVGTNGLDKVLDNFSPSAIVDKFTTQLASAEFPTDGAVDYASKAINTIDNKVFTELVGHVSDMTKDRKKSIGTDIEKFVRKGAGDYAQYLNEDLYSMTVTVGWHATADEPVNLPGYKAVVEAADVIQYSDAQQVSDFGTGVPDENILKQWVSYSLTFKKKAVSVSISTIPCKMYVDVSSVNDGVLSLTGSGGAAFSGRSSVTAWPVGSTGTTSFSVQITGNSLTFAKQPQDGWILSLGTGFKYTINGGEHMITQVVFTNNLSAISSEVSGVCFVAADDNTKKWGWGKDPLEMSPVEE